MFPARWLSAVRLSVLFVLSFTSALPLLAGPPLRTIAPGDIDGEYIVTLRGVSAEEMDAAARQIAMNAGGEVLSVWKYAVTGFWVRIPAASAHLLFRDARVASVEQNARVFESGQQETGRSGPCGPGTGTTCVGPNPKGEFDASLQPHPLWHLARISHRTPEDPSYYTYTTSGFPASPVIAYIIDGGALRFHQEFDDNPTRTSPGITDPARYTRIREVHGSNVIASRNGPDRLASTAPNISCEATEFQASMPTDGSWQKVTQVPFPGYTVPQLRWYAHNPWFFPKATDAGISDHGTGVASVLGGRVVGVAKNVTLVPVKALGCNATKSVGDIVRAMEWILAEEKQYYEKANGSGVKKRRPAVVSISTYRDPIDTGGLNTSAEAISSMQIALKALTDYGIPVFVAANNAERDACRNIPARFSRRGGQGAAIVVGGLGKDPCMVGGRAVDHRWDEDFNCTDPTAAAVEGPENGTNYGACVDIMAPAEKITVATSTSWAAYRTEGYSGTSFSAPIVAGIAARLMAEDPSIWSKLDTDPKQVTEDVWKRISASATVVPDQDAAYLGRGLPKKIAYAGAFPIAIQPQSQNLPVNGKVVLNVTPATGVAVLSYQWYQSVDGRYRPDTDTKLGTAATQEVSATASGKAFYWVRVHRGVQTTSPSTVLPIDPPEYTDSAMATITNGCTVIKDQPKAGPLNGQGKIPLEIVLEPSAGMTVTWYEGLPGTGSQVSPLVDQSYLTMPRTYWAKITNSANPNCVIESDLVRIGECTQAPAPPAASTVTRNETGKTVVTFTGQAGLAYHLVVVHQGGVVDATRPAVIVSEAVTAIGTATLETTYFAIGPGRELRLRAQNACGKVAYSNTALTPGVCPPVAGYAPLLVASSGGYAEDPATQVQAFAGDEVSMYQLALAPPGTGAAYQWHAKNFFGTSTERSLNGTIAPDGTSASDTQEYTRDSSTGKITSAKHTLYWNTITWCDGTTKVTPQSLLVMRPIITKQPSDTYINDSSNGELVADGKDADPNSGAEVTFQWYRYVGDEPQAIQYATESRYVPPTEGRYYFRVESRFLAAGNHSNITTSRVATVTCGKFPRRRSVGVSSNAAAVPGGGTQLTLPNDGDNATVNWYQVMPGTTAKDIGSGYSIWVTPKQTTTYYAEATSACGAKTKMPDITVSVECVSIVVPPVSATTIMSGTTATFTASVVAQGEELSYDWYTYGTNQFLDDGPTLNWSQLNVPATSVSAQIKVYVKVSAGCGFVTSEPVTLTSIRTGPAQRVADYYRIARPYTAGTPTQLYVTMDPPPATGIHDYQYEWFKDNGTPAGLSLSIGTASSRQVTTGSIDTYWVRITGTHKVTNSAGASVTYTEQSTSPKMYVSLYGLCQLPRLDVMQDKLELTTDGTVTFTALCDWPDVTYQWFKGQAGDTRDTFGANAGTPNQLTVSANVSYPYWVRATSDCGAYVDSPSLTFTSKGNCPPVLINQDVKSSTIAYNGSALLHVDVPAIPVPKYTWYYVDRDNVKQIVPATGPDHTVSGIKESRRYWVTVRNMTCSNGSDSFIATVRVASAPGITPPQWPSEVWVDANVSTRLNALSAGGLAYQWYEGEVGDYSAPIAGATLATYDTTPGTADAKYWVRVTGSAGIVDSPTISVRICTPPTLTTPYFNTNIESGQTASFQVDASGTDVVYQWYQGAIGDVTKPVGRPVDLLYASPTQTTSYWLRLTSRCGPNGSAPRSSNNGPFTVSVCPVVQAATAADAAVMSGATTTLSVSATGTPVTYQWYKRVGTTTTAITGATTASITSPAVTADTTFYCTVKSGTCSRNSASVVVKLCTEPTIRWTTTSKNIRKDEMVAFNVDATSGSTTEQAMITYYSGPAGNVGASTVIAGPTPYNITKVVSQTGQYWARAVVGKCHADTPNITITVCIPTITTQPVGGGITLGGSKTLTVGSDLAPVSYQWYLGLKGDTTQTAPNGTGASISVTPNADTRYWVRLVGCGGIRADSESVLVTVCHPAAIAAAGQPQPWSVQSGAPVTLSVTATGTSPKYQWYRGASGVTTSPVTTAIGSSFTFTPSVPASYWVKVFNDCGSVNSNSVQVDVCKTPVISEQPQSRTIPAGATANLEVDATQETGLAMSYQWYSRVTGTTSWTLIGGATLPTFTTPGLEVGTEYYVEMVSGRCRISSNVATISICEYRDPVSSPSDKSVAYEQATTLTMPSLTPTPDTYRWYRGAAGDRSYPMGSSYWLTVYPTVTTQYWCEVTSGACVSKTRTITVNVCKPTINTQPQSVTIAPGGTPTLSVIATAAASYQWYTGSSPGYGTAISGATSSTYKTPPLSATTSYWVKVSGCTTVNSTLATVTVD